MKFVLNDLNECWRIKNNNLINWIFILIKNFWTLTTKNQIYKPLD
jgi:hypothetical protein